ncbi:MAG TPA: 4Fe-4S dicluster domain-containing protein [Desulfomonilaceae bacterium]|nr:4Fe-4S dicluster domain-containing protein [Desulfomonilaceae bacterium]
MSHTVDPLFIDELSRYGSSDIRACFNCGNCTAVCSLTDEGARFPRKFIRYAQLGMKGRLIASKEMWLCYYCADCSATCPRQAEPGEFVAAARRYMISQFDPTTLARRLYSSKTFTVGFLITIATVLTLIMLAGYGSMPADALRLGSFIKVDYIHYTGQAVMTLAGIIAALSLVTMARRLTKALAGRATDVGVAQNEEGTRSSFWTGLKSVVYEIAVQGRFGQCDTEPLPWYFGRRFVHLSIMWGFLGLLSATGLDLLFKDPFSQVAIHYPMRLLGTIAGLFVLYGTSVALVNRIRQPDKYFANSLVSDWLFLCMLWGVTFTGFIVEITVYLPSGSVWAYVVFLIHVVAAMTLVLLLPFTKFAHAFLRPVALLIHNLGIKRRTG